MKILLLCSTIGKKLFKIELLGLMIKHSKINKSVTLTLLFSCLLFASHRINSQNFSYELLSNKEGLSQNSVSSITQDKYGFLWVGTEEGVSKFDGHRFRNYRSKRFDDSSLSNPFVKKIFKDKDGVIWIGTEGGLDKFNYNKGVFENFSFLDNVSFDAGLNSINDIIETYSGKFYLASDALIRFDRVTENYSKYYISKTKNILLNCLFEDNNGIIWVGTNEGLYKLEDASNDVKFVKIPELGNKIVKHLYLDKQGNLWIGTNSGLFELSFFDNSIVEVDLPVNDTVDVTYIFEDSDHCLWLATHGDGLITSCNRKKIFRKFNFSNLSDKNILVNYINTIYEDNSGVLWLGLDGSGIIKIEKHKNFNSIVAEADRVNKLNSNRIFGLQKDLDENKIWISTYGGGINVYDRNTGAIRVINKKTHKNLLSDDIRDIYQLPFKHNIFWVGTEKGISVYDKESNQIIKNYTVADGLSSEIIFTLISDEEENIWIATAGGLNKFNYENNKFESFVHDPNDSTTLSSNSCRLVYIDRNKNLWVGTKGSGLNRYDKENDVFIKYFYDDNFSNGSPSIVTSIYEDFNNNFWVATYGSGLFKLNPKTGKYIRFSEDEGLSNNSIYGILEDNRGDLWISSNYGLSKFNVKDASFQNYYKEDGLQGNEFNDGAFCKLDNGEMYFGGFNGITYFDPLEIKNNSVIPQIAFTSFKKGNEEFKLNSDINETKEIILSYKDIIISFEFVALSFIRNENNKYAYKLEGLTDNWINIGDKRSITFTSLDPGEYILRIKGSNNDGLWNEMGRSIKIVVTPPFYSTLIFRITLIVLIGAIVIYIYKKRIKNVQYQKDKLRKIVAERTFELETVNNNLLNEIEERKKAEEEVTRYIEELQESKDMMEQNAFDLVEINMKIEESETKLKELNAQKDKFFSIISHDLKSPFVALLGYTEILMEEFDTLSRNEMKEFIGSINKASKNVYNLLENLLEWSRIQTGRIDFIPEYFNVHDTCENVVDLLIDNAKRKNLKLVNNIETSGIVYADENMVNTILRNLVSNAIKFTEEGEISIHSEREIGSMTFIIRDTGLGMSDEIISKLFRIDVHHTTVGTDKEKGTGVGLILCKELVEKNGGEIWVESEFGRGSEFKFSLPIKPTKNN